MAVLINPLYTHFTSPETTVFSNYLFLSSISVARPLGPIDCAARRQRGETWRQLKDTHTARGEMVTNWGVGGN